ncbi:hypothetical protein B0H11DRAFT_1996537 [Mycena galericulata]|nr:hypothetical protein B0H11DRAFT_1996537 [Mycena galericulata]
MLSTCSRLRVTVSILCAIRVLFYVLGNLGTFPFVNPYASPFLYISFNQKQSTTDSKCLPFSRSNCFIDQVLRARHSWLLLKLAFSARFNNTPFIRQVKCIHGKAPANSINARPRQFLRPNRNPRLERSPSHHSGRSLDESIDTHSGLSLFASNNSH